MPMGEGVSLLWSAWCGFKRTIMWQLLVNQKRWIWLLAVLASLGGFIGGTVAVTIRDFLDLGIVDKTRPLVEFRDALVFWGFMSFAVGIATRQVVSRIGFHLEFELRTWLYHRLQSMSPRALDALSTGQVVTRALTDLAVLEVAILLIPGVVVGLVLLVGLAILLLVLNPVMAVISFAALPVNWILVKRIQRRLWAMSWVTLNRKAEVTTAIDEAIRGIRVVKAFGREEQERTHVMQAARGAYRIALSRARLIARYDMLLRALPIALNAALLLVGGRRLVRGDFTVGTLLIFLVFSAIFTGFASSFDELASGWQFARTGSGRIFELVTLAPPDPSTASGAGAQLPAERSGLALHGVGYAPSGRTLVDGVELDVAPGGLVILGGPPGSGKSLVATIAAGGLKPTLGTVLLDGVDIFAIDPHAVRQAVRMLTEEPFLFGRTVRENLAVGVDGSASDTELHAALDAAAADGIVADLPGGLDGRLGDRGYTLSGGQRQRLALARALVRPPRVLIRDDALSAVNPSLEADILARVRRHAPETAILCISRREEVRATADSVVTLTTVPAAISPASVMLARATQALADDRDPPPDPDLVAAIAALPPETDEVHVAESAVTDDHTLPSVLGVLRPFTGRAVLATVFLVLLTLASLLPEGLFKLAVDDFVDGRNSTADLVGLSLAVLGLVIGALSCFFKVFGAKVTEGVLYLLRRRTFQRLSRLGVDYYDRNLPGQVAARVVHDLDQISQFIQIGVYQLAVALTLLVASIGVVLVWSPPIAMIMIAFVIASATVTAVQLPVANRAYIVARARLGDVVERFQEDLAGRYVIDAYGARPAAYTAFHDRARALRKARFRATTISNVYLELVQLFAALATATLLARAGGLHLDGVLSVGSVISLQLYMSSVIGPLPMLSSVLQGYLSARASFRALSDPYRDPVLPEERAGAAPCPALAGDLVLDHVTFRYPGTDRPVLEDVSLEVPPSTVVALVGPTGAGKSSIAKLAARVYDPDAGAVLVDGHDLRDLDLGSFRRRLGIVPQDAFCFRGSVASNIAYGRPDAAAAEIEAALRAVGALDDLAELPGGLEYLVEEEGRNLTPMQRQHIALARAVLVEPDVLILDEATSNLDERAEQHVLDAVRGLGRTTIFITHRLSVARSADRVVVVDGGRIAEVGTHDDLMGRDSAYRRLWSSGPEVEAVDPALRENRAHSGSVVR
jgi:ATP-binding cassette subfamily B protein